MIQEHKEAAFAEVVKVISQYTDVELSEIKPGSELICDLGLTSFDLVCLSSSLESEFNVMADEKTIKGVKTVADVHDLVRIYRKQIQ